MNETILIDKGGQGYQIEDIWAWVAIHGEDDESIVSHGMNGVHMPLMASKESTVRLLRPVAERIAKTSGKELVLKRFVATEHLVDHIKP